MFQLLFLTIFIVYQYEDTHATFLCTFVTCEW